MASSLDKYCDKICGLCPKLEGSQRKAASREEVAFLCVLGVSAVNLTHVGDSPPYTRHGLSVESIWRFN